MKRTAGLSVCEAVIFPFAAVSEGALMQRVHALCPGVLERISKLCVRDNGGELLTSPLMTTLSYNLELHTVRFGAAMPVTL